MKKFISIMLAFTMVFMLSACGNSGTSETQDNTVADVSEEETQDNTEESSSEEAGTADQQTAGESNILISYFSFPMDKGVDAVATAGRTQHDDGTPGNINFHMHPALATAPENLDDYVVIYIGFPIW